MRSRIVLAAVMTTAAAALVGCSAAAAPSSTRVSGAPTSTSVAAPNQTPAALGPLAPVEVTVASGADAGAAKGHSLDLPAGWTAEVWANVTGARLGAWTSDGRLLITTGENGTVVALTPGAGGAAATASTLLSGLDDVQGIAIAGTTVVIGETDQLVSYVDAGGRLTQRHVIVGNLPTGGHGSKMVAIQGDQVVYNVGSAGNRTPGDRTATPVRATIEQIGLDGSDHRVLATGVRNGEGLSFAPDGTLYTAINQDDNQPYPFPGAQFNQHVTSYVNEHPNDQISPITAGTDMGWPLCVPDERGHDDLTDLGYVNDPEFNADGSKLDCSSIGRTQVGLPAHSAPVGFTFTQGSALPASLASGAIVTAHGSWNRTPPRSPYVAYLPWDATTQTLGAAQVIVTGFQNADGSRWGRSVDAIPGPDGALYVTDDAAGLVYRLTPA